MKSALAGGFVVALIWLVVTVIEYLIVGGLIALGWNLIVAPAFHLGGISWAMGMAAYFVIRVVKALAS